MQPKRRTFVRGIIPNRLQPQNAKPNAPNVEKVEGVGSGSDASQSADVPEDVEFDEDSIPEHERHSSFLSHHIQRPHWKRVIWEDVRVGDIVKILTNEAFPADILICSTSEDENVAFVETKNLDGETSLKSRTAVSGLTAMRSAADSCNKDNAFSVDLDRPDSNMFRLNSTVNILRTGQSHAADISNTVLRGTVLRNTDWVIGVVLFTGEDTKIVQKLGSNAEQAEQGGKTNESPSVRSFKVLPDDVN